MTLYELSVAIRRLREEFGDDVEIKNYSDKSNPHLFYSIEDDCVYIDTL